MPYRRRIAIWIGAGCLLVAALGYMQFQWIDLVDESQRVVSRRSLNRSLRLLNDKLRHQTGLFLTTFKWDPDLGWPHRLDLYGQRYLQWHEVSAHGPVVKRILFYENCPPAADGLKELIGESHRIEVVPWTSDLGSLRRYFDEYGLPHGTTGNARWAATWMFHPGARALFRPIMQLEPASPTNPSAVVLHGYLILQLDFDYVRDRLLPDFVEDSFLGVSDGVSYDVTISLDGSPLFHYQPAPSVTGADPSTGDATSYGRTQLQDLDEIGPPDQSLRLLLSDGGVPNPVLRVGGIQRIGLRDLDDIARLDQRLQLQPSPLLSVGSEGAEMSASLGAPLQQMMAVPRLFVLGDRPYQLSVDARHSGTPLDEVVNSKYRRSLAGGMVLLGLLVGAMAMVAISGRNAARLAEVRMNAAASQAHELRTPVAGISALADNMVGGMLGSGNKVLEYGELIRALAQRQGEILDRMVEESSMKSFQARYTPEMLDISRVASDVLARARATITGAGFEAECSLAEGLPMVSVDEEALRKSLGDLISNAVKYGLPGRWLKVETSAENSADKEEVQIRVHDRGRGIPPREAEKIFEPYYRMAKDASSGVPGSGLGLKLVQERVRLMGGKVTLESEPGRGSVFTIHIPVGA